MAFSQSKSTSSSTAATTIAVTLTSSVNVGDVIVVGVGWGTTAAVSPTVTDTLSNTYTLQDSDTVVADNQRMAVYKSTVTSSGTPTITYNIGANCAFRSMVVGVYSGQDGTVDQHGIRNTTTGSTATDGVTSPTVTTVHDGETIIGIFLDSTLSGTYAAGTGFNALRENTGGHTLEDKVQTSQGSITATETWSSANHYLAAIITLPAVVSSTPMRTMMGVGT